MCEEDDIELNVSNTPDYSSGAFAFNWWFQPDSASWTATGDSVVRADAEVTWAGDYIVKVSQTFNTGFSSTYCEKTDTVNVIVNPLPDAPLLIDKTYCQFEPIDELITHVTDSVSVGAVYLNWYNVKGGTAFATNDPFIVGLKPDSSIAATSPFFYVSTVDINGCESYVDSFVVNINPLPEKPTVADLAYCEFDATVPPLTATPAAVSGYTLTWYDQDSTGASIAGAPTPDASVVDTLYFYVTQTNDGTTCESFNAEITVYIKDVPSAPAFLDPTYCLDATPDSLKLHLTKSIPSITSPANELVHWNYPSFVDNGSTSPYPSTADAGSTFGLVWEEWIYTRPDGSDLSCLGPQEDLRVIVNPKPVVSLIAVNALCIGQSPQADGNLYVTDYRDGDTIRWHAGSTWNPTDPTILTVPGSTIEAAGGIFASNLSNPTVGSGVDTYAVEITNAFGCTQTGTVDMTEKDCVCPGGYCEPATVTPAP